MSLSIFLDESPYAKKRGLPRFILRVFNSGSVHVSMYETINGHSDICLFSRFRAVDRIRVVECECCLIVI